MRVNVEKKLMNEKKCLEIFREYVEQLGGNLRTFNLFF